MLVKSLGPDRLLIRARPAAWSIEAPVRTARSFSNPRSLPRSSHSRSEHVRGRAEFTNLPERDASVERITPPMIRAFRDRGAQSTAGIARKERLGGGGWCFRKPDVVPPGNAVLGEHHGGVVAEQRCQAGCRCTDTGGLERADDDILPGQTPPGSSDALMSAANSTSPTRSAKAIAPDGFRCARASHRTPSLPGQCEPREMAADGAARGTDAHGVNSVSSDDSDRFSQLAQELAVMRDPARQPRTPRREPPRPAGVQDRAHGLVAL